MVKDIFKVYLSHHIRGPNGINATKEEIENNIKLYKNIGEQIRAYFWDWEKLNNFPKMELYVPADHDEFVQIAFDKKYVTEEQILTVDCGIINTCSLLIAFGDIKSSRGMIRETDHALTHNIPMYSMPNLSDTSIGALKFAIHLLLTSES